MNQLLPSPPSVRNTAISQILAALACLSLGPLAAQEAAETPLGQVCNAEGAFGLRFGDKNASTQVPKRTMFFGQGCYQVSPPATHPSFDTYAACVSEFDGKIFLIQALKVFDDKPPQGSSSLTPTQVESNRRLGQQVLDDLLNQLPAAVRATARVTDKGRSWEVPLEGGVRLEVSNSVGWAITLGCRNEDLTQKVFRQRLQGK